MMMGVSRRAGDIEAGRGCLVWYRYDVDDLEACGADGLTHRGSEDVTEVLR